MKIITEGCSGFYSQTEYEQFKKLAHDSNKLLHDRKGKGSDFLGWLDLPYSITTGQIESIKKTANEIKNHSDVLVVIGIGGSYLGAKSAIDALSHSSKNGIQVIYAGNNISGRYIENLIKYLKDKDFSLNVISKSGTTTEPAIAFRILKELIERKYGESAYKRIYSTTDVKSGTLRKLTEIEGYTSFVIPSDVGGRYSVLTACGLLPMSVAGIEINNVIEGARYAYDNLSDQCIEYAVLRNIMYQKDKFIEIMVTYDPDLQFFAEWWKQLYGESEGKDHKGIFPCSVLNTTDLHSMGQYIQEGRRNIFETILYVNDDFSDIEVPYIENDFDGLNYISKKKLQYVNKKAMQGTMLAHSQGEVPSILIELPYMDEFNYGALVYFFEKACALSGYILGVNPFDQPGVEAYKKNMFKLLGKPEF